MILQPIGERVLLKRVPKVNKTSGGIYIPDSTNQEQMQATVISVGKFQDGTPLPLNANDSVIYLSHNAEDINYLGQTFVLVDFKDILLKVQQDGQ